MGSLSNALVKVTQHHEDKTGLLMDLDVERRDRLHNSFAVTYFLKALGKL